VCWIQYYSRGRKIWESTDTAELGEAKDLLKKREGEAVDKAPATGRKVKMPDQLQDLENDYKINGYCSLMDLERRLNLHTLPLFGKRKAPAIEAAEIRIFASLRLERGTTKNDEARIFSFTRELQEIRQGQKAKADELAKKKGRVWAYVFNRHGQRIKGCKSSWTTAREAAGVRKTSFTISEGPQSETLSGLSSLKEWL
jgi:hypothetical protein